MKRLILLLLLLATACSKQESIGSLLIGETIDLLPAHPNNNNYDYLISISNSRDGRSNFNKSEDRSLAINYIMENVCDNYEINYEQIVELPNISSLRLRKIYYYFIDCN